MEREEMTMSTDHLGYSPETAERLKRIFDSLERKDAIVAAFIASPEKAFAMLREALRDDPDAMQELSEAYLTEIFAEEFAKRLS